jgi:hypothetical protein
MMVDIPELFREASDLSCSDWNASARDVDIDIRHSELLLRAIDMYSRIQTWYLEELAPFLSNAEDFLSCSQSLDSATWDGSIETQTTVEYPEFLLAVLDCVTNLILIRLQELLFSLPSGPPHWHQTFNFSLSPITIARQQAKVRASHAFVKRKSRVAAKTLEFGLQQLWSPKWNIWQFSEQIHCTHYWFPNPFYPKVRSTFS